VDAPSDGAASGLAAARSAMRTGLTAARRRAKPPVMDFDLVIFDCDGVLIDSEVISARMLVAELARLDVHIDLDFVARHFLGRSYPVVMQQIRRDFGLDLPPEFEAACR
jgi:hypothetical protein